MSFICRQLLSGRTRGRTTSDCTNRFCISKMSLNILSLCCLTSLKKKVLLMCPFRYLGVARARACMCARLCVGVCGRLGVLSESFNVRVRQLNMLYTQYRTYGTQMLCIFYVTRQPSVHEWVWCVSTCSSQSYCTAKLWWKMSVDYLFFTDAYLLKSY